MARIPDPVIPDFGAEWDQEWEKGLFTRALERVSQQIDERQFQIFDLYVSKDWPARRLAKMLGVSVARVYLTKHRVAALVKKEVRRLEKMAEQALKKTD
jgi:RNA polymerase sigma-70 factor (ECF subfamily)